MKVKSNLSHKPGDLNFQVQVTDITDIYEHTPTYPCIPLDVT